MMPMFILRVKRLLRPPSVLVVHLLVYMAVPLIHGACQWSDFSTTEYTITMSSCGLTVVTSEDLEGFSNIETMMLSGNMLTEFPNITTTVYELQLSSNEISSVDPFMLENANVGKIFLNRNQLTTFPNLTAIASSLRYLNLAENTIATVDPSFLAPMVHLYDVNLGHNLLTSFPNFIPIAGGITTLRINHNFLTEVSNEALAGFVNLGYFRIHNNQLTHFPNVSYSTKLTYLSTSSNQYTSIDGSILSPLANLNKLYIGFGPLKTFRMPMGLCQLRHIDLALSKLTEFPDVRACAATLYHLRLDGAGRAIKFLPIKLLAQLINLTYLSLRYFTSLRQFPHITTLTKLTYLELNGIGLVHVLPPVWVKDFSNFQLKLTYSGFDLCACNNAWLKEVQSSLSYDDVECNGFQWSNASLDTVLKKCTPDNSEQNKVSLKLEDDDDLPKTLNSFLVHSFYERQSLLECTITCQQTDGCVAIRFRFEHLLQGDCVLIGARIDPPDVTLIPHSGDPLWFYYPVE